MRIIFFKIIYALNCLSNQIFRSMKGFQKMLLPLVETVLTDTKQLDPRISVLDQ